MYSPLTELTTLHILPPYTLTSPCTTSLLASRSRLQSAFSGNPLYWFYDSEDGAVVYLFSPWESVDDYKEWVKSRQNRRLLRRAKKLGCFAQDEEGPGSVRTVLTHIELDTESCDECEVVLLREGIDPPWAGRGGLFVEEEVWDRLRWTTSGWDVEGKHERGYRGEWEWRVVVLEDRDLEGLGGWEWWRKGWRVLRRVRFEEDESRSRDWFKSVGQGARAIVRSACLSR